MVGEEILTATNPEIRMIYVTAGNPVCMAPNTAKIAKAFDKAEFVVYSGHFMDDTTDHADVFLPATTFLEEDDVVASYGHNFVGPVNKAIEPVGECKSEFHMFYELAARFPFAARYRKSVDEWLQVLCAPIWEQGCTLEELRKGAFRLDAPMVPYADKTFRTASGKYQFMTEFDDSGHPGSDPAYPYKLLTIAPHGAICSELTMAEHDALPAVVLHMGEAARLGLEPDRPVLLRSAYGAIKALLKVADGVRSDVVMAERGGWAKAGHGLNLLTRDMSSLVGQGTPFYETTVAVEPCPDDGLVGTRILVIQLSDHAPGGNFSKSLQREGALLQTLRPDQGDALPETPEDCDGLVVLGGPQHAFDDASAPYFQPLLALMRSFDAQRRPVAGICLGCQLLARAHGAKVWTMNGLEYGFVQHSATREAKDDPVLGPSLPLPRLMEFHEDTFGLPAGAVLLARGEQCAPQCFRVGRASYGFQFHLEVDATIARNWIELFRKRDVENYAVYREHYSEAFLDELAQELPLLTAGSEAFCRKVARHWLALCARLAPGA